MALSVRRILEGRPVEASAPCRIDAGGTWDIKALALPLDRVGPVTVNFALNLRTRVVLSPFTEGRVKVSSDGFSRGEDYPFDLFPFNSPFGLFFAAVSYFGFHGLEVTIRSGSPVKSALGGSSTALVALIRALSRVAVGSGGKGMSGRKILHLGYHLEDGVSPGKCGIQDQAAAVYGGVNLWKWRYGGSVPFEREPLATGYGLKALSRCILVAYSGRSHVSSRINRDWIEGFLSGRTREGWIRANETVKGLGEALRQGALGRAARLLRDEMAIRREITPDALIPVTEMLIDQAEAAGCGARFTGAGGGGSVWALGEPERIEGLRMTWEKTLKSVKGGLILDCSIDPVGVR